MFDHIERSIPHISLFERLGYKDGRGATDHRDGDVTTSNVSIFNLLRTTRKLLSKKILLEYENQYFYEDIDDEEIYSAFLSHIKRKTILSITTDDQLRVK